MTDNTLRSLLCAAAEIIPLLINVLPTISQISGNQIVPIFANLDQTGAGNNGLTCITEDLIALAGAVEMSSCMDRLSHFNNSIAGLAEGTIGIAVLGAGDILARQIGFNMSGCRNRGAPLQYGAAANLALITVGRCTHYETIAAAIAAGNRGQHSVEGLFNLTSTLTLGACHVFSKYRAHNTAVSTAGIAVLGTGCRLVVQSNFLVYMVLITFRRHLPLHDCGDRLAAAEVCYFTVHILDITLKNGIFDINDGDISGSSSSLSGYIVHAVPGPHTNRDAQQGLFTRTKQLAVLITSQGESNSIFNAVDINAS